jgi:D-alanyl-D-alanine carboxypeptidase
MGGLRGLVIGALWLAGLIVIAVVIAAVVFDRGPGRRSSAPSSPGAEVVRPITPLMAAPATPSASAVIPAEDLPTPNLTPADIAPATGCDSPAFAAAARANANTLTALVWSPFRRREIGWQVYAPSVGREIGSACRPESAGFAEALSRWQTGHKLPATGVLDDGTFAAMRNQWELARPFVRLSASGVCPPAPASTDLATATPAEGYAGKTVQLTTGALTAYRRMVAAARHELPTVAADKRLLAMFSGYRSPEADAARCARDGDCAASITRAACSAHRTGTAVDLVLDADPAHRPDSAADPDRLRLSRSPTYAWLIARAGAFGFINYPFEPWHWEWTGRS